ncbi:MAG TPA: hypothetical protein VIN40_11125 [Candidatus Tyrphobacter sp.]
MSELNATFRRSWDLLSNNVIIVVPGLIVGILATGLVIAFIAAFVLSIIGLKLVGGFGGAATVAGVVVSGVIAILLLGVLQATFVTAMAGVAWQKGAVTLGDGWHVFVQCGGPLLGAAALLTLIGLLALALAPFTFLLSLPAFAFLFVYTLPATVLGGRHATAALAESWHLAIDNAGDTAVLVLVLIVLWVAGTSLGPLLAISTHVFAGITIAVIHQAILAYGSLVACGAYQRLRERKLVATEQ